MQASFRLTQEQVDGIEIVQLSGALDTAAFPTFKKAMDTLCASAHIRLLVDCSELEYMNSASLGQLNYYQSACKKVNGRVVYAQISPKILEILKLLGLDRKLSMAPTRDKALDVLRAFAR